MSVEPDPDKEAGKQEGKDIFNKAAGATILIRHSGEGPNLEIRDLTIRRPISFEVLIRNINLSVKPGERMIVMGPAGCGKSTMLRALAGLWDAGEGHIQFPAGAKTMFVPQARYIPLVPLKAVLAYPSQPEDFTDEQYREILERVGLPRLIPNLANRQRDGSYYARRLSGGEQQRLIFARILLNKPDILIMDEVTSSLDEKAEMELYKLLVDGLPSTAMISISHRSSIIPYHTLFAEVQNERVTVTPLTKGGPMPKPPRFG
jgi:putative ATP-binding cassette transporter